MIKKSDSKWLSLATVPILGQPPINTMDWKNPFSVGFTLSIKTTTHHFTKITITELVWCMLLKNNGNGPAFKTWLPT